MDTLTLYHGSQVVVRAPSLAKARPHNDYGPGFYTTPNKDSAGEWACQHGTDGFINTYVLENNDLCVLDLMDGTHTTLEWIALLLANRRFDMRLPTARMAREQLTERFLPCLEGVDVVCGYRADDSYFSFARAFVENALPLSVLQRALVLGKLGEQVVLVSEESFTHLSFEGYDVARAEIHYPRFVQRDQAARADYQRLASQQTHALDELYVIDILRGEVSPDDPRLRPNVPARR